MLLDVQIPQQKLRIIPTRKRNNIKCQANMLAISDQLLHVV